jgi:excisionase family DNA binding protein
MEAAIEFLYSSESCVVTDSPVAFQNNLCMERSYIKVEDAAHFLCVSKSKIMKMCMLREITYYKAGRLNVFLRKDLEEYLSRNTIYSVYDLQRQSEAGLINLKN